MREFGSTDRVTETNDFAARQQHLKRVLDVAKWPEQEEEEEDWDIAKWDEATRDTSPSLADRDGPQTEDIAKRGNVNRGLFPENFSHADSGEGESRNNIAMIGLVVGLLVIGGGIYAYEISSANTPALPAPAMKPPAPVNSPPPAPSPTAPPTFAAPPQTVPDVISPAPGRAANSESGVSRRPPPFRSSPAAAPRPEAVSPDRSAQPPVGLTYNSAGAAISMRALPHNDPLNAPMTLTPDTAPPPQH